jgi:hypothetical protein
MLYTGHVIPGFKPEVCPTLDISGGSGPAIRDRAEFDPHFVQEVWRSLYHMSRTGLPLPGRSATGTDRFSLMRF